MDILTAAFPHIAYLIPAVVCIFVLTASKKQKPNQDFLWIFTIGIFIPAIYNTIYWPLLQTGTFDPDWNARISMSWGRLIYYINFITVASIACYIYGTYISKSTSNDLKKILFSFKGRIGRRDYWFCTTLLNAAFFHAFAQFAIDSSTKSHYNIPSIGASDIVLLAAYVIPWAWIGFATQVKRWHDRSRSGWMILINLIPFVGGLWALIENGFLPGHDISNEYGDSIQPQQDCG